MLGGLTLLAFTIWLQSPPSPDPLSGGAGWIGAGMLGLVLAWLLLKYLPSKDQQMADFMKDKDDRIKQLVADKDSHVQRLTAAYEAKLGVIMEDSSKTRANFREALDEVLKHCEEESRKTMEAFKAELKLITGNGHGGGKRT